MSATVRLLPTADPSVNATAVRACAFCKATAAQRRVLLVGADGRAICERCARMAAEAVATTTKERA